MKHLLDNKDAAIILKSLAAEPAMHSFLEQAIANELVERGLFDMAEWKVTSKGRDFAKKHAA